jgi:hypothetical protein
VGTTSRKRSPRLISWNWTSISKVIHQTFLSSATTSIQSCKRPSAAKHSAVQRSHRRQRLLRYPMTTTSYPRNPQDVAKPTWTSMEAKDTSDGHYLIGMHNASTKYDLGWRIGYTTYCTLRSGSIGLQRGRLSAMIGPSIAGRQNSGADFAAFGSDMPRSCTVCRLCTMNLEQDSPRT